MMGQALSPAAVRLFPSTGMCESIDHCSLDSIIEIEISFKLGMTNAVLILIMSGTFKMAKVSGLFCAEDTL